MAFKVTYSFVAEDKFSSVAAKIADSAKNIDNCVQKLNDKLECSKQKLNETAKSFNNLSSKINTVSPKVEKVTKNTEKASSAFSRFTSKVKSAVKNTTLFGERLTKISDMFGMQAYYQFMNVALPMGIIAKLGLDYADSLESANIQMEALFSHTKNYAQFQAQINKMAKDYAQTTRFSVAQIMQAAATVGSMTGNIQAATRSIPVIMKYAIATGQTKNLTGAAQQFIQGVISGKLSKINLLLTGGSAFERLNQALDQIDKRYKNILVEDSKSASTQVAILNNNLKQIFGAIMDSLAPAFKYYGDILDKYTPKIVNFINTHKGMMVLLGKMAIAGTAFLGVLMGLGVVIGLISMPFQALNAVLKISAFVLGAINLETLPLTASILAISAAVVALVLNFTKLKNMMTSVLGKIDQFKTHKLTMHLFDKSAVAPSLKKGFMSIKHFFGFGDSKSTEHNVNVHVNIADKGGNVRSAHADHDGAGRLNLNLGRNLALP